MKIVQYHRVLAVVVFCMWSFAAAGQTPTSVANGVGQFAGASELSVSDEAQSDSIAALEQQAFREFRWDVMVSAVLRLQFEVSDPEAASARLMVSSDGEAFQPLVSGEPVQAGQVVSLLISQPVTEGDGTVSFPASDWVFDIAARPLVPQQGDTTGPVLLPIVFGDDLGCEATGCGESGEIGDTGLPLVAGEPRSEPSEAPAAEQPSGSNGGEDLARELQSELARVGCYTIAVDGLWGPGSRRAIEAFNTARGTDLPVANPTPRALVAVARETQTVCEG